MEAAAEEEEERLVPVPPRVHLEDCPTYNVDRLLGKGGFGQVHLGKRATSNQDTMPSEVALKFEHLTSEGCTVSGAPYEWQVYEDLGDTYGIPRIYCKGQQDGFYIMVMDLLGRSLWYVASGKRLPEAYVACVAVEALIILQNVHEKGYVHGDVKPENFLLGPPDSPQSKRLFLVDLGLASKWRDSAGRHSKYYQYPDDFGGTIPYASVHAHLGRMASRRDDLESLAYTLLFLLVGRLPWQGDNSNFQVCKRKMAASVKQLCRCQPTALTNFMKYVLNMEFDEEPKYAACISLFHAVLVGSPELPLDINQSVLEQVAARVGQKRRRGAFKDLDLTFTSAGEPRRRWRLGYPAEQWITVYNKHVHMKQRYHFDVSAAALDVHVEKGIRNGLYISSVGCANNLWAVILNAGTGFTEQRYTVASNTFLPKKWIMEHWDRDFFITAVAGSSDRSSLVVMSKGTQCTDQIYKVAERFPFLWVEKQWEDGYWITSLATAASRDTDARENSQWAVVMSRTPAYNKQCVELDFQYPSEGIHCRRREGLMITALAATPSQTAVVLSMPMGCSPDEAQEVIRTPKPPSRRVQEKRDKDLYIAGVAYGRTVC